MASRLEVIINLPVKLGLSPRGLGVIDGKALIDRYKEKYG